MNKNLENFLQECVTNYVKYEIWDDRATLNLEYLPDFVRQEFAALIMADDEDYACEATGADNKHWNTKMLPALIRYLANSTDPDEGIEFKNIWRDCVTDYMSEHMQDLLDDALSEYNFQFTYGEVSQGYRAPEYS